MHVPAKPSVLARLEQARLAAANGRTTDARKLFDQALRADPRSPDSLTAYGLFLAQQGEAEAGRRLLRRAIAFAPDAIGPHINLSWIALQAGAPHEALTHADAALERDGADPVALHNRGIALHRTQQPDLALASLRAALPRHPAPAAVHADIALSLRELDQPEAAIDSFRRAIALRPADRTLHFGLAQCQLLTGDYAAGLDNYECRDAALARPPAWFHAARLQPDDLRAGRPVLLHAEQGFGDTIQFCRYATLLAGCGARVTLSAQPALLRLLQTLPGVDHLCSSEEPTPPSGLQCPLLSLPRLFATRPDTIPAMPAYLQADPALVATWSQRLGPRGRPRIGLNWSGRPGFINDAARSLTLLQAAACLPDGFEVISLQRDLRPGDAPALAALPHIRHFGEALTDFAETAALAALVDVVVTTDTAVAHLAGALGRPTWIMLPHVPDWRWGRAATETGTATPWYPTARLFRQPARGAWNPVLRDVNDALRRLL